jgi:hypothetical protein
MFATTARVDDRCEGRARMRALVCALAFAPLVAQGQAEADAITPILAQANAKLAAGTPEAAVDAWIQDALRARVQQVNPTPPPWDVYAQAQWRRVERAAPVAQDMRRPTNGPVGVFLPSTNTDAATPNESPPAFGATATARPSAPQTRTLPSATAGADARLFQQAKQSPKAGRSTSEP